MLRATGKVHNDMTDPASMGPRVEIKEAIKTNRVAG